MKLIDKDPLVAEIDRLLKQIDTCPKVTGTQIAVLEGNKVVLTKIRHFVDNLEVKEVDLENKVDVDSFHNTFDYINDINCGGNSWVDKDLQESFELFKVQKGE